MSKSQTQKKKVEPIKAIKLSIDDLLNDLKELVTGMNNSPKLGINYLQIEELRNKVWNLTWTEKQLVWLKAYVSAFITRAQG